MRQAEEGEYAQPVRGGLCPLGLGSPGELIDEAHTSLGERLAVQMGQLEGPLEKNLCLFGDVDAHHGRREVEPLADFRDHGSKDLTAHPLANPLQALLGKRIWRAILQITREIEEPARLKNGTVKFHLVIGQIGAVLVP